MKIKPVFKVRAIFDQNVFFIDYSEQTYQKEKLEKAILWSSDSQLLLPPPPPIAMVLEPLRWIQPVASRQISNTELVLIE